MNALQRDLKQLTALIEEKEYERVKKDPYRLKFHLMPKVGWLNDPNGLCQYKGTYHVFFQYSPFNAEGGLKFWGHYTSLDLINWEYKGTELFADQPYDCHGVYSGSALIDEGKMYLYYTGNVKHAGDYDYINAGRGHNTVVAISEDGINFKHKQLLMENKDYPEHMSCHIRDPKVWQEGDTYYMVQGARDKASVGQIIVFESKDRINWCVKNIVKSKEKFGYMWECPDYLEVDGQKLLMLSPQGIEAEGIKYQNIYQSGYYKVTGDIKAANYELGEFEELDRGFDFYAPQTFLDDQGRRILIGWMGMPDITDLYENPTVKEGWQHALTVPRVLSMRNGKLHQNPVSELEALRGQLLSSGMQDQVTLEAYETFDFELAAQELKENLEIVIRDGATLTYNATNKIFSLNLNESGYGRTTRSVQLEALRNVRVLGDTSALEIFVNDGEEVFATRYYPKAEALQIMVKGEGLVAKINLWEMKAMTIEDKTN